MLESGENTVRGTPTRSVSFPHVRWPPVLQPHYAYEQGNYYKNARLFKLI